MPFLKGDNDDVINAYCADLKDKLSAKGIRVKFDDRDMRAGDKTWEWIKKGVPLRVEAGGREVENGEVTVTRRDLGKSSKQTLSVDAFVNDVQNMLDKMQSDMFNAAKKERDARIFDMNNLTDVRKFFEDDREGFIRIDFTFWDTDEFNAICSDFAVTPRCLPFETQGMKLLIGKSY